MENQIPAITSFKNEYWAFSNFYKVPIIYEDKEYPSVEHAFHAAKTLDLSLRIQFQTQEEIDNAQGILKQLGQSFPTTIELSPSQAKTQGRRLSLKLDWEEVKLGIMYELNLYKFTHDKLCREKLLSTGDAQLVEGNGWGDKFWGVCVRSGIGKNHLGKILMRIRDELHVRG